MNVLPLKSMWTSGLLPGVSSMVDSFPSELSMAVTSRLRTHTDAIYARIA